MFQERSQERTPAEPFIPKSGEAETIEERIAACRPEILTMCRKLLRGKPNSETLAEDIAQETIMKAVKHADSFKGGAKLTTWLGSIARNTILDHFRMLKRRPQADAGSSVNDIAGNFPGEDDFISAIDDKQALKKIGTAIDKLKKRHQLDETDESILNLRYHEGLQTPEIAERLGMKNQSVKSRLFRVRDKIQKELALEKRQAPDSEN